MTTRARSSVTVTGERITDADGRRWYWTPDGRLAPGVTSIVGILPKPQLDAWRAKHGDRADVLAAQAADFGTNVHAAAEAIVLGQPLPTKLTAEERAVVEQISRWLDRRRPQGCEVERTLLGTSAAGPYAGTADVVCVLDGERTVLDYKTGSGPHLAQRAQLAAYSRAVGATRALLLFATADGVREAPVDLERGWLVFTRAHALFVALYEPPCIIELAA